MLTYEFFLKNRNYENEFVKPVPLKKIFVKKTEKIDITIDDKTLEEYGGIPSPELKALQEALWMPLSNLKSVGLPQRATSPNADKPYVKFNGLYKNGEFYIFIGNKKKIIYKYNCSLGQTDKSSSSTEGDLVVRLDEAKYFLPNMSLFKAYKAAGIIDERKVLDRELFTTVCSAFIEYCKSKDFARLVPGSKKIFFELVVLPYIMTEPGKDYVEYRESTSEEAPEEEFTDSFGLKSTGYPSETTQTASFMSFDDGAFTINCTEGKDFYSNLGIGQESLKKINLPPEGECEVPGASELKWYFFSIDDPDLKFDKQNTGFYDQLLFNYRELSRKAGTSTEEKSIMKIIGLRKAQKKTEILLDENLTLDQLHDILVIRDERSGEKLERHPMVLESLIVRSKGAKGPTVLWNGYISAIHALLSERPLDRNRLIKQFAQTIKGDIFEWINDRMKVADLANKLDNFSLCVKLLTAEGKRGDTMDTNEEYAYRIGKIAGGYIKYKRQVKEETGSTNDILTYVKYDREALRFVYSRMGKGLSLSKAPEERKTAMMELLKQNAPTKEIEDSKAFSDYSYFFYKGVFEELSK